MKSYCFGVDTLIRDKKLAFLREHGAEVVVRKLDDGEYATYLKRKIAEEGEEVRQATTPEETLNELVDIYDAMMLLLEDMKIPLKDFEAARQKKTLQKGSYGEKLCLCSLTVEDNTPLLAHCRAHPAKYTPLPHKA